MQVCPERGLRVLRWRSEANQLEVFAFKMPNVELSGRQRQDARPGLAKMYRVPPDRAWWPAVGAPLERRVRRVLRHESYECWRPVKGQRWHGVGP